ncbi:MAG TPA: hypothetical protein VIB60_01075 [Methylomirabilota bacterium]
MNTRVLLTLAPVLALWTSAASAADPVAVLTEIRPGKGEVRVKRPEDPDWSAPRALQSLRPGDQVRVTADGRATVTFTGGGSQSVTAATSPLTVQAPRGETGGDRARGLVAGVTQFLLGQPKPPAYQSLSVRAGAPPPRALGPRDTRVLPGPVTFEWSGPPRSDYRVQLLGPQGPVWEQAALPRRPLPYPAAAPPLVPGARYGWTLEAPGQATQRADFEVLSEADAARVRALLADLTPAALGGEDGSPLILMRAGLFFREGLYADARRELIAAIAKDPDEPTLRQLLGYVYDRMGLTDLAAQELDEAEFLATRKP